MKEPRSNDFEAPSADTWSDGGITFGEVRAGTPAEEIDILRKAFDETVGDPQFLADAERMRISIAPLGGAQVQDLIRKLYATPKPFVDRAKSVIKP